MRRSAGFLLLPVSLLLLVIGVMALGLTMDLGESTRASSRETERARRVAEAGLAHAVWQLNQITTCSGYPSTVGASFGKDKYAVAISPNTGSPVTLSSTAMLASGLTGSQVTIRRQVAKTAGATLTYTLTASTGIADTELDASSPSKNYGGSASLQLQRNTYLPLLRFDLSSLPPGSRITDAQLVLYREDPGSLSLSLRGVDAFRVLEAWIPGTKNGATSADGATWQTRDGATTWQVAGASIDTASALDYAHYHSYLSLPTITWSVTNLVQGWVDGRYPNYGLILNPSTSFTEGYGATEAADPTHAPKLVIKYVPPCGALNPPQDDIGGRVAWWKFDETTGSSAGDAIGGHTGTITGGSWVTTGVSSGALSFATGGKVSVAYASDLSMSRDFTVAAWINMNTTSGKRSVLYKGTATNEANYAMGTRDGEMYFEYYANSAWRTYTTTGLNLRVGTFYHLAATYKDSTRQINLYVDGRLVSTATASFGNTPVTNSRGLLIGTSPYNDLFLGRLDDVQILSSALNAGSISALMGGSVRTPDADAYVYGQAPYNVNYGASTPLSLSYFPDVRPLMHFDVSSIPDGTVIKRAILSFHIENPLVVSLSLTARLYPLSESWVEGTQNGAISSSGVSWTKRQNSPDIAWTSAGGTYAASLVATLTLPFGAAAQRYWEMDITPTVQEWVDGVRPNYGLVTLMTLGFDSATISSRESLHQEPRLLISTQ